MGQRDMGAPCAPPNVPINGKGLPVMIAMGIIEKEGPVPPFSFFPSYRDPGHLKAARGEMASPLFYHGLVRVRARPKNTLTPFHVGRLIGDGCPPIGNAHYVLLQTPIRVYFICIITLTHVPLKEANI